MTPPCPWKSEGALFQLERHFAREMMAHAQAEAPNECCGMLAGAGGKAARLYRTDNAERSPMRYSVDPRELLRIHREMEAQGWDLLGIYHSHTHSPAYPSATDVELAFWPDALYFIVSLQDPARPILRAFHIMEGRIKEEELEIA